MADVEGTLDLRFLKRIPLALVLAIVVQTGAGLLWAGAAAERIRGVEQRLDKDASIVERLARLEAEVEAARASLARLEQAVDQDRKP